MGEHTPGPWAAYDPCYGTCPIGGMPCTPEGCSEDHPVGVRCVEGPEGIDGDIELASEADARLIAASPDLLDAYRTVLDRLDYLRSLWGDEAITRNVADQLRAAVEKATQGRETDRP